MEEPMENNTQTKNQTAKKDGAKKVAKAVNYGGLRIRSMAASSYDIWTGL